MKCYLMIRRIIALVVCAVQFILGLFGVSVNPMKNVIEEPNLAPQAIVADQSGSKIADAKFLTDGKVETYWSSGQQKGAYVELRFLEPVTFNTVVLRELTTSVKAFALQKYENGQWVDFFKSDRIETYRFCTFDPVTTQRVRLVVRGQVGTFACRRWRSTILRLRSLTSLCASRPISALISIRPGRSPTRFGI